MSKPPPSPIKQSEKPVEARLKAQYGFGTFRGVYIPSILTILGVIMYLRLGWVVGNVGLVQTWIIVSMATAITFLTGLSISATATNMKVGGGGAYYMISRSFGVEAGAAIGIPLFLAQALGVTFYLTGFAEALHAVIPVLPMQAISIVSLCVLTFLAYKSADLALKAQFVIFGIIILSLLSFFFGGTPKEGLVVAQNIAPKVGFWVAFSVFFPAVTGIEAGISMSGDLKDPSKALPLGTLAAVLTGYAVYMILPMILADWVPSKVLRGNLMVMKDVALVGALILLGVWAATLSSALGALLGAPRTLQALARDRIVPSFLGKGDGQDDNPKIATAVSFILALSGIFLGNLDAIAPVLSMFFLTSYGFLNLIAGLEQLIGNPSWRPTFRVPWTLSLAGSAGCFATMFMINAGATFIAGGACAFVFYLTYLRNLNARWGDLRRAILTSLARFAIYRLSHYKKNPKTWRPHFLVLSGSPTTRWYLIELADAMTHGRGFMTVAAILSKANVDEERILKFEASMREFLSKNKIPAIAKTTIDDDIFDGAESLIRSYGMGPITPNTIVLGETEKEPLFERFSELLIFIYQRRRNVLVIREGVGPAPKKHNREKRIDIWWTGYMDNAWLMLALAYMIQTSPEWRGVPLRVKRCVKDEEERQKALRFTSDFIKQGRIDAEPEVYIGKEGEDALAQMIKVKSHDADLVFLGMRPPKDGESPEEYSKYYKELLKRTEGFPPVALTLAHENLNFKDIFK